MKTTDMKTHTLAILVCCLAALASAPAATKVWNNASSDFNDAGSWTGGLPNSQDTAQFDTFTTQPVLSDAIAVGNLDITAAGLNLTGGFNLVLREDGISSAGSGTNTINTPIVINTGATSISFDVGAGNTLDLQQAVTFTGKPLIKTGDGVLKVVTNVADASSGIQVLGGTLYAASGGFSAGATSLTLNGGRLQIEASDPVTTNQNLVTTIGAGGGVIESSVGAFPNALRIGGVIAGSGDLTFTTSAGGRLIQLGDKNNTHDGNVFVTGTNTMLRIAQLEGVTDTLGDASIVSLAETTMLDLNIGSETIGGLTGSGTVQATSDPFTLTVGGGNKSSTFAGTLQNNTATLSLTKTGTGTFTLSGTNTYTGSTAINAGTLLVGESASLGNTAVSIAEGATLAGGGAIAGTVATAGSGSELNPLGHLSLGSLDASAGGTFSFELGVDQIHVAGLLTGGGFAESLQIAVSGGQSGVAYTLFDFGSASGLDVADFSVLTSGYVLDTTFHDGGWWIDTDSGRLQVRFAAIPEPSALLLTVAALAAGILGRRKR